MEPVPETATVPKPSVHVDGPGMRETILVVHRGFSLLYDICSSVKHTYKSTVVHRCKGRTTYSAAPYAGRDTGHGPYAVNNQCKLSSPDDRRATGQSCPSWHSRPSPHHSRKMQIHAICGLQSLPHSPVTALYMCTVTRAALMTFSPSCEKDAENTHLHGLQSLLASSSCLYMRTILSSLALTTSPHREKDADKSTPIYD